MSKRSFNESNIEDPVAVEDDIRSLHVTVWNLGERGTKLSLEQDIQNIASLLRTEYAKHGDPIFDSLRFCLLNLSYKSSLYVAVLSLLSEDSGLDIKGKIKDWIEKCINETLADSNEWRLGHALRTWCELASNHLISSEGLIELFQNLANKGHSLSAGGDNQKLASYWIGKSIMLSLPFGAIHLKKKNLGGFDALLSSLNDLFHMIKNNMKFNEIIPNVDVYSGYLFNLATPLEELVKNDFRFELNILNPDQSNTLDNLISINIVPFELPSDVSHLNLLRAPFHVHDDAHRKDITIYDCWLMNNWLSQIIDFFALNHSKCIETLFAAVPEDFGNPAKIIQNVLFGELLRTHQHDPFYQVYPEILFIDGCRFSKTFPPALARAIFKLVGEDIEGLSYRAIIRLASWFALHLSSFDFKWPWDEWKDVAENWSSTSLKRIFIQESFDQTLRLSYYERISNVTPEYLKSYLPPQPKPNFSFTNTQPDSPEMQFQAGIKTRQPVSELVELLQEVPQDSRKRVLAETVLNVGSKTISHANSVTERVLPLLKKYFESLEEQMELIQIVSEFWMNNTQNFEITIKRYLECQLVSKEALIGFITISLRNAVDSSMTFDQITRKILRLHLIDLINEYKPQPFPINLEEVFKGILVDSELSDRIHHFFATLY